MGRPITSPVNKTSEDLLVCKVDTNKSKQYYTDKETFNWDSLDLYKFKSLEQKGLNDTSTNVNNNTDDENLPLKTLKPKVDSKDTSVRPRANSKTQESKYLKENLTNVNNNYTESDGETLPLRSMVNSEGIEK